ncbi:MAG: UDP-N-acetylglucosamine 2-epimerase (non-hydrolyzing), partial [Piscirickettsiaceae bacterium]
LHTGQHYDQKMKDSFFDQLGIPEPDVDLGVGAGSHTEQTANIMLKFEKTLDQLNPKAILVVGDVNSTIACALVAVKKGVPIIHVEAGLRSGDRQMPEEINRILTDQISDILFTTEADAIDNLVKEGIDASKVHFTGNVMIDTLMNHQNRAIPVSDSIKKSLNQVSWQQGQKFGLVTLHRPSNVDDKACLTKLVNALIEVNKKLQLVFPIHPRTAGKLDEFGLTEKLDQAGIVRLPPAAYLEILGLMKEATLVLTDSGGIQEETTAFGTPCITLRESTERPVTVTGGTNTVVGTDADKIIATALKTLESGGKKGRRPELWDGKAAIRIAEITKKWLANL